MRVYHLSNGKWGYRVGCAGSRWSALRRWPFEASSSRTDRSPCSSLSSPLRGSSSGPATKIFRCSFSNLHGIVPKGVYARGLQCSNLDGNQTANDRYWQNNKVLLLAKCMKFYTFFSVCIFSLQETVLRHRQYFLLKYILGIQKSWILCLFQKC